MQYINEAKRFQKLAGIITEAIEVTNTPIVQNLEKKAFDFFNQPEVVALLKKEIDKLSPEKKSELANTSIQESETNDFNSFKSTVEKTIGDASLNEYDDDAHDYIRKKVGGYKSGEEPTSLDKSVGTVLKNLGVANIMSMGFLPALTAMAIDKFGGTDIIGTVSQAIGDGGAAAALSVLAGLIGGGILWKLGKILKNEKVTDNTALFEETKRFQKLANIITEEEQTATPSDTKTDAEIDAAMKAGLSALTSGGASLDELKDDEQPKELNESIVVLIGSALLAAPKVLEWIGKAIGFITKPFRKDKDENEIAKKIEHFAHKWESVYIKAIIWVVKKTKFVQQIWMTPDKKIDEQKLLIVAKYIYAGILAIAMGQAIGAVLGPASPIMKAIEGSLGTVKAIEIAQIAAKVKGQLG